MNRSCDEFDVIQMSIWLFIILSLVLDLAAVALHSFAFFLGHIEPVIVGLLLRGAYVAVAQFSCFLFVPGRSLRSILHRCFAASMLIGIIIVAPGANSTVKPLMTAVISAAFALLVFAFGLLAQNLVLGVRDRTRMVFAAMVLIIGMAVCLHLTGYYWVDDF